MSQPIDIALAVDNATGLYDINFENGDFQMTEGFDTSLIVSLFADARASSSQIPRAELRRGWWGNQFSADFPEFEIGSKLWLLSQSRNIQDTLNSAIDFAKNALQWLVTNNHAKSINVTGAFINDGTIGGIRLTIVIDRGSSITETKYYDIWNNTGKVS